MGRTEIRSLITGATGQDGAYLARLLLGKGRRVYCACRRNSSPNTWRLEMLGVARHVEFVPIELLEASNVLRTVEKVHPDEIYNLAAQSFVGASFEEPVYTGDVTGLGTARLLEALRGCGAAVRFYQASSSEMYGNALGSPQGEGTPFQPTSPYAAAKLYAHWMTVMYRKAYGLHACCGIAFNHESPLRGPEFVTQKIVRSLVRLVRGAQDSVLLGNLDARRDWGFAGDYVEAMWRMLQHATADDYVLATGESHSVREFVEAVAGRLEIGISWQGRGAAEEGIDTRSGRTIVSVDPALFRPSEIDHLVGDPTKARAVLGWCARTSFSQMVELMVEAELRRTEG